MISKEGLLEIMGTTLLGGGSLTIWIATYQIKTAFAIIAGFGIIELLFALWMFFKADKMRDEKVFQA